jgi:hypothetical protein
MMTTPTVNSSATSPSKECWLIDYWSAHYYLDHNSYRLGVRNSVTNQGAWWVVPQSVIAVVARLFEAKPDRIEFQSASTPKRDSLQFSFSCSVRSEDLAASDEKDITVQALGLTISVPDGAITPHVVMPDGGEYFNASAGDGSIEAFLRLLELVRSKRLRVGYDGHACRINFNFPSAGGAAT